MSEIQAENSFGAAPAGIFAQIFQPLLPVPENVFVPAVLPQMVL